ncbi:MAG TPA: sigma-54 dependent transcriptional regulator [Nitrospiraceae bacterium]|nr:sigma-54 dependent transcriptional regulator [Nitrospiraceae bacterium]
MNQATLDRPSASARAAPPFTILVVDDNPGDTELILQALEEADLKAVGGELQIEVRATAEGALKALEAQPVDLILTDLILPGMDGLDLVSRVQEIDRNLPVLLVTRMNAVGQAVEAMKRGAYDYVIKPVNADDLGMRVHRAIRFSEILRRNSAFERRFSREMQIGQLVGVSAAFQAIMTRVQEAAQVRSTVLIQGETGTGKGRIARAIHEAGRERDKPFQVIDCATFPEGMMESELFGHVRGAFTGAIADKPGLIELAQGGTVFLDEIGELPPALQAKLLRVLEENEVRPVGGTRIKHVDMRVIAATNQDLAEKVRAGSFRKDLYFRLAVITINVPPLRSRVEDIPVIARHLLAQYGREMGRGRTFFDPSAFGELARYSWPGNVRELRNVIERALMLAKGEQIMGEMIRPLLQGSVQDPAATNAAAYGNLPYMEAKRRAIADFTAQYLRTRLAMHEGVITKAAESSGIPRQHFALLMKRFLGREDI